MSTQLVHLIWSQEEIDAAVAGYRERVREGDGEDLKTLLMRHAIDANLVWTSETVDKAKSVMRSLAQQDMSSLFEPPSEVVEGEGEEPTLAEVVEAESVSDVSVSDEVSGTETVPLESDVESEGESVDAD